MPRSARPGRSAAAVTYGGAPTNERAAAAPPLRRAGQGGRGLLTLAGTGGYDNSALHSTCPFLLRVTQTTRSGAESAPLFRAQQLVGLDQHQRSFPMLLKTKALTTALLSGLCVSAMAAAQESRPAGQTPPPAETGVPTPAVGQPDTTATPEATGTTGAQAAGKRAAEEPITVTGSRIRRKDLTTPAPVTVISREQVIASGKVSIGDFLQSLPEQGNAINTAVNNGGDGSTRVSLRGLGSDRTLVLLNGRRMVPGGTGANTSVDLNSIPTAAIERIEILKDGASAVYGSDAIAGVVNIITRKNYRQTDLGAYTGMSQRGDGTLYDFNVTTGTGGDRGNITFSAGYSNQQPTWAGDREWSRVPRAFNAKTGENQSTGSGTIPQGRVVFSTDDANAPILPTGGSPTPVFTGLTALNPKTSAFIRCTPAEIAAQNAASNTLGGRDPTGHSCKDFQWRA